MTARPYIAPKNIGESLCDARAYRAMPQAARATHERSLLHVSGLRLSVAIASIAVPTFAASWFAAALLSGWAR